MSYCVNCGVELDSSAKKCALCGTQVINPAKAQEKEETIAPFSDNVYVPKTVKARFIASLVSVIMLVPNMACLLVNFLILPGNFWSVHILSTSALLWVILVLPLFKKAHKTYFMWAFDTVAVGGYAFLLMNALDALEWYTTCALPITVLLSAMVLFYIIWVRRKKRSGILKALALCAETALAFLFSGVLLYFAGVPYAFEIGLIVFVCIVAVVGFLAYCYKSEAMRNWLSKKLFT
ncbi:MAG: zinc ribbon domain-containing protein [Clostridia bacterium]|nr:zinc ribbon domain-containing protein [Clostridia bacterium]